MEPASVPAATGLTDEQDDFVAALRDFCARELTDDAVDRLTDGGRDPHSHELARQMARLGWYGLTIPERFGGSDGTFFDATLFLEEFSRGRAPIAAYGVTLIVVGALNRFGSEAQKADLLSRVADGGTVAIAMSEPDAGSDVAALSTRARPDGEEWVLSGTKMWCSYSHKASHVLVVCRTGDPSERHRGLSMLLVPTDAPGLSQSPIRTLGGDDEVNEIVFDDVRVPADALVGVEGEGWTQLMAGLNNERVILAAMALGLAQRAFDDTLEYVKQRRQFGQPIGSFQALQHRLADLATELVQVRLLVRWVARMTDEQPDRVLAQEASMAKLAATELAKRCALESVQMAGGYGYASEYPMERHLRTAVVGTIYGGTSEIQKNIIAKTLGL